MNGTEKDAGKLAPRSTTGSAPPPPPIDYTGWFAGAAQRMLHYELHTTTAPLDALVDVLVELTEIVRKAVASLDDLRHADGLRASLIQIHTLENKADAILRPAIGDLFRKHTDARDIIKWKEVYEHLETATDRCEDVADQLENILLEYA